MKHIPIHSLFFQATAILILFGSDLPAQEPASTISRQRSVSVSPIEGTLFLVGKGAVSRRCKDTFSYLAGEQGGSLVVITSNRQQALLVPLKQWKDRIGSVTRIVQGDPVEAIDAASAVWIEQVISNPDWQTQLQEKLQDLLQRSGVVGGIGTGAAAVATEIFDGDQTRPGLSLLPNSIINSSAANDRVLKQSLRQNPARVGWTLPAESCVVIHEGRRIAVIGDTEITLHTAATDHWPARVQSFGPPVDQLPYTADLISWNRSGLARTDQRFPSATPPTPEVEKGALLMIGGGGSTPEMWHRLIELAGGTEAKFVCLSQDDHCAGANILTERGCIDVTVHQCLDQFAADTESNESLLSDLKDADAVYFGGGRTFRFMDAYEQTRAHSLMRDVLARGGIIAGTSAGAQIQGDFLVRGDPRTNQTLWHPGNDRGLGFLQGVIIDAHFRQRGRQNTLPDLLEEHPQMLGIGLDEATALLIQGSTAEVLGKHKVTFFDTAGKDEPILLEAGQTYDLATRKQQN